MTRSSLPAAIVTALWCLAASPLHAQVTTGTIVGTINDASGIVPGATVVVREMNKGTTTTYVTDERGILYGPGHVNFDTSLSKRVAIAGDANVEFRWDAFNLFNHPGFGFPNQNVDAPTQAGSLQRQSTTDRCSSRSS